MILVNLTVMLDRGIKLLISFLFFSFFSCDNGERKNQANSTFLKKSLQTIGEKEYAAVYKSFSDTLYHWKLNKLYSSTDSSFSISYLDSLLCFNKTKNRMITCVLYRYVKPDQEGVSDEIDFFYGEKINEKWYFFGGSEHLIVPRDVFEGHDIHKPLSYIQLHQMALKEVYGGYLKGNGEINEEWFTARFENVGWCGKCKTTEDFQKAHLENVRVNWMRRDTTQPIKQLPVKGDKLP